MTTTSRATTADLQRLLLWAREHSFRVQEVEMGGVRLVVEDVADKGPIDPGRPVPRNPHEAFALEQGIPLPPDDEDEDEAR